MSSRYELDLNPSQSAKNFFKQLTRRLDGLLLLFFSAAFILCIFFPTLPIVFFGPTGFLADQGEARLVFMMMPFALFSEYVWFASSYKGRVGTFMLCAILTATAFIPFFKILKGMINVV